MQEIYRSFEGKLNVDCQNGYIILELKERYQIEWLSVWGKNAENTSKKKICFRWKISETRKEYQNFLWISNTDVSKGVHIGIEVYGTVMKKYWRFKEKIKVTTGRRMYKTND